MHDSHLCLSYEFSPQSSIDINKGKRGSIFIKCTPNIKSQNYYTNPELSNPLQFIISESSPF